MQLTAGALFSNVLKAFAAPREVKGVAVEAGSTCPNRAIALLLVPRFLARNNLNSQLTTFSLVSNYLTLYCCFYRYLNPCREIEPHNILYGSPEMTSSGIFTE